ncbi:DEAD/DEAH box helicase [Gordonia liuliyuniae]|uniref:DEAD/DEAH box helicase n=1 Tax=Gordonia liuliyuniae TaxID=2911517 RepID=A0ABS9IY01_9ACTN|nr:DEAD/DEAH box helicase [Gordonia liuliyuniae]MCF8590381.1 DEAD/DEAH box helicase [Gordonia liuliyuniae]
MTERLDPLHTGRGIESDYKRYLKTLVSPRIPDLAAAFDEAVDSSDLLTKGPLLELTPPYEPSKTARELIDDGVLHPDFGVLGEGFNLDQPFYAHQECAIRKVTAGRNLVVSTGTGSGKTESFLVPILNSLIAERAMGTLGPGVRALLLYPMNALANDQLKRLRGLLAECPELTFGRYTGETEEKEQRAAAAFAAAHPGEQRLSNELLSREEMRRNPPHILLTNYAMLEYLLLRPADTELFDGAHAGDWQFVALDEAHVYDGAQGAEVALLLRRLHERVAHGRRLQYIATSASLTGRSPETSGVEAAGFATDLFAAPFEWVDGDESRQDVVTATRLKRPEEAIWALSHDDILQSIEVEADRLHEEKHIVALRAALAEGPVDVAELRMTIFPGAERAAELLDGLVAIGSASIDDTGNPVLSARYHMFVRATEGAFVAFGDAAPSVHLGRHEIDPVTLRAVFEFGTCQRCGAVHLAGTPTKVEGREFFKPANNEESVRWLVLTEDGADGVVDEDEETFAEDERRGTNRRTLCGGCGVLADGPCTNPACVGGPLLAVREHPQKTSKMGTCTQCGARARQVIRRLRTDVNAAPAVVSTSLYQELPTGEIGSEETGDGRKLLMFSDSRQAAAFAAPYMERTYGRLLQRRYLTQALQAHARSDDHPADVEDLAEGAMKQAQKAYYFHELDSRTTKLRAVNRWVMAELMAVDQRQTLEGVGLMSVDLKRLRKAVLPRGFTSVGLDEEQVWALLTELVKTVRLQGAMTLLDDIDIRDEIFEPRNVSVRIRAHGSDKASRILSWMPSGDGRSTNKRIQLVTKVLTATGATMDPVRYAEGCWTWLAKNGYVKLVADQRNSDIYQVSHKHLALRSGPDVPWFRCTSCRRLTPHDVVGVCPEGACNGTLETYEIPRVDADQNHYRSLYQTMVPAPMSAMEHTAQWRSVKAAEIQQDFVAGKVNILSCSTTFELGVDVGDLQSVMLRNMPPRTANYVQRAGRAGRRAASAAFVVTYARRNSHDLSKYQNPESMIAGEMRIPWIPIDNERIARRHVHSVALAAFLRHKADNDGMTWTYAGDFFSPDADGSDAPSTEVTRFLRPVPDGVAQAIDGVLPPELRSILGIDDGTWVNELDSLLDTARLDIRNDIETYERLIEETKEDNKLLGLAARLQKTLTTIMRRQLIGYLANTNVLPKYGFPVDTVDLRTIHCDGDIARELELSRDLAQAVYDYAPGNQVVAGGKLITSRGLHKLPKRELRRVQYRVCRNCGDLEAGVVIEDRDSCPQCQADLGHTRVAVFPEFGFVADHTVQEVRPEPPERRWGGTSHVENLGEVGDSVTWPAASDPKISARAGTRARMMVISDGGGPGFHLCDWCGWATPALARAPKDHRHPVTNQPCVGFTSAVSLVHRYETDVAEITLNGVGYTRDDEPQWLSALYALLEGASEALEISADDIGGTLSWTPDGDRSIVLFDTVPAGAGAVKKIVDNLDSVLATAHARVDDCDCGKETSCYGCLRSFRNSREHEQLSREGALRVFAELGVG